LYLREPSQDIDDKVVLLGEERKAVLRGWQEKGDWLRQVSPPFFSLVSLWSVRSYPLNFLLS
jgi:hypothetical protein